MEGEKGRQVDRGETWTGESGGRDNEVDGAPEMDGGGATKGNIRAARVVFIRLMPRSGGN